LDDNAVCLIYNLRIENIKKLIYITYIKETSVHTACFSR